ALTIAWLIMLAASTALLIRLPASWPNSQLNLLQLTSLIPLGALLVVLGGIAVLAPPNTEDSMTYHLPRVVHWEQNASLAPYATHCLRQLDLQPGAEFVLLHLRLLSGGDLASGAVQLVSMVGSLVVTSLIASGLGAKRVGQLFATRVAASVPIGVLEATST